MTNEGFILITPERIIDFGTLSKSRVAAQFHVVGVPAEDGRMHTWGWYRARGWRCKPCELVILSGAPDTNED